MIRVVLPAIAITIASACTIEIGGNIPGLPSIPGLTDVVSEPEDTSKPDTAAPDVAPSEDTTTCVDLEEHVVSWPAPAGWDLDGVAPPSEERLAFDGPGAARFDSPSHPRLEVLVVSTTLKEGGELFIGLEGEAGARVGFRLALSASGALQLTLAAGANETPFEAPLAFPERWTVDAMSDETITLWVGDTAATLPWAATDTVVFALSGSGTAELGRTVVAGCGNALFCSTDEDCKAAGCGEPRCSPFRGCEGDGGAASCDDGIGCTVDACTPSGCTHTVDHAACDDGEACTGDETCDAVLGCVAGTAMVCDDGDPCSGAEGCKDGTCKSGEALVCDDGDPCNGVESCATGVGCQAGVPMSCDDGDACNGLEGCDAETGCLPGTPPTCTDGEPCNGVETCVPASGCVSGTPLTCSDGNPCNGVESCDGALGCLPGQPLVCADGSVCNGLESCDPEVGCVTGTPLACDDGLPCNGLEACDPLKGCLTGAPPPGCCTAQEQCEDGNPCNGLSNCEIATQTCTPGAPLVCGDDNPCNGFEACDPVLGCVTTPPLPCDDGNLCNGLERCDVVLGCLGGTPITCDDGLACTGTEQCDPLTGCRPGPAPVGCCVSDSNCDDGNLCNGTATCDQATKACVMAPPPTCTDGNICNGLESCAPASGCVPGVPLECEDGNVCNGVADCEPSAGCLTAAPLACDDGNVCNGLESCDTVAGCKPGAPLECGDGLPCNGIESCDPAAGCVVSPPPPGCCASSADCEDGNQCNGVGACQAGSCVVTPPVTCSDGNPCNGFESCHPQFGCVAASPLVCADGNACNGSEQCDPVSGCLPGTALACDDGSTCTTDYCHPVTGCVNAPSALCGLSVIVTPTGGGAGVAVGAPTAIAVPPGAVSETMTIDVTPTPDLDGAVSATAGLVVSSHRFEPEGTSFALPITVVLPLDAGLLGLAGDAIPVVLLDETSGEWVAQSKAGGAPLLGVVADDPPRVTFEVTHFSTYGVGLPCDGCCSSDAECEDGQPCTAHRCEGLGGCVLDTGATPCDDGDACTDDGCGPGGECVHTLGDGNPCDDGDGCTVGDTCEGGTCQTGAPKTCATLGTCGVGTCEAGACVYAADVTRCPPNGICEGYLCDVTSFTCTPYVIASTCDDGEPCTGPGVCSGKQCLMGGPILCNDGNNCTADSCKFGTGCQFNLTPCTDGNPCTVDTCVNGSGCVGKPSATVCDDGDACTVDSCNTSSGCKHVALVCDDTDPCTVDACDPATGCTTTPFACNDGVACTTDSCISGQGCTTAPDHAKCNDNNPCTADTCGPNGCKSLADKEKCDDGNPCSIDLCLPNGQCIYQPATGQACDDGLACTGPDLCTSASGCGGPATSCDDGNACTNDACAEPGGCFSSPRVCDDGVACTIDSCDAATGCVASFDHSACDDDDRCTIDVCASTGCAHTPSVPLECVDGSPCTLDACQNDLCDHPPEPQPVDCDDGSACTEQDLCTGMGACAGITVSCNDQSLCTADSCDPAIGCVHVALTGLTCNDGDPCTLTDKCTALGVCSGVPKCTDTDVCTVNSCDPSTGVCGTSPLSCDDGDPCTDDSCTNPSGCKHTVSVACIDTDKDGTFDPADCLPWDPYVHPAATESCNRYDDDCDGATDEGACGLLDECTATEDCAAGACQKALNSSKKVCVTAESPCIQELRDHTVTVTSDGSMGCSSSDSTALCQGGEWVSPTVCPANTPACANGGCAACEPGTRLCVGNEIFACSSAGVMASQGLCSAGQACMGEGVCTVSPSGTVFSMNAIQNAVVTTTRGDGLLVWGVGYFTGAPSFTEGSKLRWLTRAFGAEPLAPVEVTLFPKTATHRGTASGRVHATLLGDGRTLLSFVSYSLSASTQVVRQTTVGPAPGVVAPEYATVAHTSNYLADIAVLEDGAKVAMVMLQTSSVTTRVFDTNTGTATAAVTVDSKNDNAESAAVVPLSDGGYGVVWYENEAFGGQQPRLFMRKFTVDGSAAAAKTALSVLPQGSPFLDVSCALTATDAFRCTWCTGSGSSTSDVVRVADFDALGTQVGATLIVPSARRSRLPGRIGEAPGLHYFSATTPYAAQMAVLTDTTTPPSASTMPGISTYETPPYSSTCGLTNDGRYVCPVFSVQSGGGQLRLQVVSAP